MTSTSADSTSASGTPAPLAAQTATGPYMLTLCRLAAPVSIRPPKSPHLKPFTFFMSRAPQPDGGERLYLHMGYFGTLADARKWLQAVRGSYPNAIATLVPPALSAQPDTGPPAPAPAEALTDTQVMGILEKRRAASALDGAEEGDSARVPLLRPEDTSTRRALKEAVGQGAPVSFAVQLQWSPRVIDPGRVPALPLFEAHTLYTVQSHRQGRTCHFLRLGFFSDPMAAKEVAVQVRSRFASAAVVPVTEEELVHANEARVEATAATSRIRQLVDSALSTGRWLGLAARSTVARTPHRDAFNGEDTLDETLEVLAKRELMNDSNSPSDTGVRHLRIEVQR